MRSEENRCERAIDTTKTTKRKQTTNCLRVYHMDAESNAELLKKKNETRSVGQKASHSTERLLATESASASGLSTEHRNVQFVVQPRGECGT